MFYPRELLLSWQRNCLTVTNDEASYEVVVVRERINRGMVYKITKQEDSSHYAPLFRRIDELLEKKEKITIAIDGNCASGKSTLAALLKTMYECSVFAMDDFFLQPYQRTPERYAQPGGNVDYERFQVEVLAPLLKGVPFSYRQFDCITMTFREERVTVTPKPLQVIEGAYSLHPYFEKTKTIPKANNPYDLKMLLTIDSDEQRRRLKVRNPEKYERFIQEWMPYENKYLEAFDIAKKCDMIFHVEG